MPYASPEHASYGHLGQATYESDNRQWRFWRAQAAVETRLWIIDGTEVQIVSGQPAQERPPSSYARRDGLRATLQDYPDLVPALPLLPHANDISGVVQESVSRHDGCSSDLLAVGRALRFESPTRSKADGPPVVAFAYGPDRRVVCISLYTDCPWSEEGGREVKLPRISTHHCCFWTASAPIEQLCFSRGSDGSLGTYLAVRTLMSTTVIRPRLRGIVPDALTVDVDPEYQPRTLEVHVIRTIPPGSESAASPQLSVAFNPLNERQFAVLSDPAVWSIWDVESSLFAMDGIVPKATGCFARLTNSDGWARLIWLAEPSVLIGASRDSLSSSQLDESEIAEPVALDLSRDSLLDVRVLEPQRSQVLLLTVTRVLLVQVRVGQSVKPIETVFELFHYQHTANMRLQMCLHRFEHEFVILLYGLGCMMLGITVSLSDESNQVCGLSSPWTTHLPLLGAKTTASSGSNSLPIEPLSMIVLPQMLRKRSEIYSIITLASNLALFQRSCWLGAPENKASSYEGVVMKHGKQARSSTRIPREPFIVPDLPLQDQSLLETDMAAERQYSDSGVWTLPLLRLARQVSNAVTGGIDARAASDALNQEIRRVQGTAFQARKGLSILRDLITPRLPTNDLHILSDGLHGLLMTLHSMAQDRAEALAIASESFDDAHASSLQISTLYNTGQLGLPPGPDQNASIDLVSLYDRMLPLWVGNLHAIVPSSVRLAREKVVREIALQCFLSAQGFRLSTQPDEDLPQVDQPESFGSSGSADAIETPVVGASSQVLRQYTTFEPAKSLSPLDHRILSLWDVDEDPSSVVWQRLREKSKQSDAAQRTDPAPKRAHSDRQVARIVQQLQSSQRQRSSQGSQSAPDRPAMPSSAPPEPSGSAAVPETGNLERPALRVSRSRFPTRPKPRSKPGF